jgi:bifunctional non-homologous end joining protein LigD
MKYAPMLAKIGTKKDLESDFIFEPKLDGYRAICKVHKKIKLYSRRGHDIIDKFPEFDFRKNIKAKSCVLDGEIIVYDKKGDPTFNLMQHRYTSDPERITLLSKETPAVFAVFDILMKDGKNLTTLPLLKRRKILEKTIKPNKYLEIVPEFEDGKKLWKEMKKRKLEGVMAKEKDGIYQPGARSNTWLKIKFHESIEAVIIGYTIKKRDVSSLALGLYKKDELRYVGKVGTGLNTEIINKLDKKLPQISRKTPPVTNAGHLKTVLWVRPSLVCEVKFQQFTNRETLRIPVFLRLRDDKKPKDCTFKQIKNITG